MARLVKNLIGGIASRVYLTGSESYESEELPEEKQQVLREDEEEETGSGEGSKMFSSSDDDNVEEEEEERGEEEEEEEENIDKSMCAPQKLGTVSKWTNYLTGWQDRYLVVRDGIMSYYRSELDLQYGCRGSLSLQKINVHLHEFDDMRFDVRAHDCTYFFRATSVSQKNEWIEVIEANKKYLSENGFGNKAPMTRQGSILSLSGLSQASTSSFKTGHDLQVKLAEMETYKDILCRQIDLLQMYFDSCAENNPSALKRALNGMSDPRESNFDETMEEERENEDVPMPPSPLIKSHDQRNGYHNTSFTNSPSGSPLSSRGTNQKGHRRTESDPFSFLKYPNKSGRFTVGSSSPGGTSPPDIDFRGEAITFKATATGVLTSLSHCIEVMSKREEYWQKKFDKERERRRKAERAAHSAVNGPRVRAYEFSGPDLQEGPHSTLNEDEFFDALEMAYQEDEIDRQVDVSNRKQSNASTNERTDGRCQMIDKINHVGLSGTTHRLTPLVDKKVSAYALYIFEPVDTTSSWIMVHEDADMKVYRKEVEEDGVVVDPLKAQYVAEGMSASEVVQYFYDKDTRLEWESTIEKVNLIETLADDTAIFHQLHKRVWPSTQRETLFCSHICTLSNAPRPENMVGHTKMVCNFSLDHPAVPNDNNKLIRCTLQAGLVCQTIANRPVEPGTESSLTRNDISCKMMYAVNVNPGGWAPPSVVRTIGKREICKFLKKFSGCASKATAKNPLTL